MCNNANFYKCFYCFNRYMVECESYSTGTWLKDIQSFNRYMVECESRSMWRKPLGLNVLIDTWWNVNTCPRSTYNMQISFNRYMVECEYLIHDKDSNIFAVLIDTWWNVNLLNLRTLPEADIVLIDTWWNVNKIRTICCIIISVF